MQSIRKEKKYRILLILGIGITILGFFIHFLYPAEMMNSANNSDTYMQDVEDYDGYFLEPNIKGKGYQFKIDLWAQGSHKDSWNSEFIILILDMDEYNDLKDGEDPNDLKPIETIKKEYEPTRCQSSHQASIVLDSSEKIYILVINESNETINIGVSYYYSVIPPTYYIGLLVAAIGIFFSLLLGIIYYNNWKRYFLVGALINSVAFILRIATLSTFFNYPILNLSVEMYSDYQAWYMGWSVPFKEGWGLNPYNMFGYVYGPLFMLTIGPFSFLPNAWGMGIPLFAFGIATGYLVFKIVYKLTENEKRASIGMLIYFLNPFTLCYSSFLWLNPSIFTFFVLLSFYFLQENRKKGSLISLGIATMYKQFAVIFFPLIIIYILRNSGKLKFFKKVRVSVRYAIPYVLTILIISIPFLVINYQYYIYGVFLINIFFNPEHLNNAIYCPNYPIRFMDPFILLSGPNIITFVMGYMITYYILLGLCFSFIYLYFFRVKRNSEEPNSSRQLLIQSLFLSIFLILSVQLFYPRGTYKFYLILLTPFISIFYDHQDLSFKHVNRLKEENFKPRYLIPLVISWGVFFCFRYVYFLIIIFWMVFLIYIYRRYKFLDEISLEKKNLKSKLDLNLSSSKK